MEGIDRGKANTYLQTSRSRVVTMGIAAGSARASSR